MNMNEELRVKKWGWENAAELTKSPENIIKDFNKSIRQVVVVSAIRSPDFNTTDYLIELWTLLSEENIDKNKIDEILFDIKNFHLLIISEKIKTNNVIIANFIENQFWELLKKINFYISSKNKIIPKKENDYTINTYDGSFSILWFWEVLSSQIQAEVINNLWIDWLKSESIDLNRIVNKVNLLGSEEEVFTILSLRISKKILNVWNDWKIPIVPGFIPWFEWWIEKIIWRWYSDATAAMTALWFSNVFNTTLEIQKSVEWMLSSDPRIVKWWKVKLIDQIDYLTAKEITWVRWAQAKLLHYQVLRKELQEAWINVVLFDPFKKLKWTLISKNKNNKIDWVEFIWWRNNIVFFSISSWSMYESWILSDIFSIVKDYASIDIVSTSETEISFTIDWWLSKKILDNISYKIKQKLWMKEDWYENFVRYRENKALIFCVWQNLSHSIWSLGKAAIALAKWNINIEMVSQWTMERAIIFWIDWKKMNEAINLLHEEFIV